MPLTKAQCTNCGSALEVDSSQEAAVCPYCNTPYIVEKAINNYTTNVTNNIQAQNVTIVSGKDFDQILQSAKALLGVSHKQGLEACNEALSLQPTNYEVWALLAKYWVNDTGKSEIDAIKKVVEYTPDDRIADVSKDLINYLIDFREEIGLSLDAIDLVNDYLVLTKLTPEDSVLCAFRIKTLIEEKTKKANTYTIPELQEAYKKAIERCKNDFEKCGTEFKNEYENKIADLSTDGLTKTHNSGTNNTTTQKTGGCYVATAVYGSYDCPQVWTLRRYRDYTLAETWYGRAFIHTYYAVSPTLVKWFGNTDWFKKLWHPRLDRMVERLNAEGVENTPYADRDW